MELGGWYIIMAKEITCKEVHIGMLFLKHAGDKFVKHPHTNLIWTDTIVQKEPNRRSANSSLILNCQACFGSCIEKM